MYYRLRQVDTDGMATYSPVRTVQVPFEAGLLAQAHPNPSQQQDVTLSIRTSQAGPVICGLPTCWANKSGSSP
ncbi:hypothetical protein GO988_06985 [Hymenobacter sp. HMF4947]|uniref:Uncharacterized protein n=1 Tax=Hymenobacter ginkgonis TaxID=2682976 RepID=A0A7K1TCF7_9BACT|nr:hypothetical protein [Hymenobacter ginkgonis]MVN76065.1 hypothetical protein [Hymenobacter ginkgonis]